MMGFVFPNSVFKHNTHPRSAMSKCNSDLKYQVICKNISQCVKLNPRLDTVYAEVLAGVDSKGNSVKVYASVIRGCPMFEKTVSPPTADTEICRGMGNVYMWPARWKATRGNLTVAV